MRFQDLEYNNMMSRFMILTYPQIDTIKEELLDTKEVPGSTLYRHCATRLLPGQWRRELGYWDTRGNVCECRGITDQEAAMILFEAEQNGLLD